MTTKMLINAQNAEELRIAVISDGKLDRYELAAAESGLYRGNIYRGVVASIQPSLGAAFVEIGVERQGLLRAEDVVTAAYHRKVEEDDRRPRIDRILERMDADKDAAVTTAELHDYIAGLVLAAELINTALEQIIDLLHPGQHPMMKLAKDCAAGAVLISAITALAVFIAFLASAWNE